EVQAANGAASRLHSNPATPVPPASVPLKVKLGLALPEGFGGCESIVVVGAVASTVQLTDSLSTLPALSVATTSNTCGPSASGEMLSGEVHGPSAAPSKRHSVLAIPEPPLSVALNPIVAAVWLVGF